MFRESPASTPPRYCHKCGSALAERREIIEGDFNPFSGMRAPSAEKVEMYCPNQGISTNHGLWVLYPRGWQEV